jgi:hypothetical protein
MSYMLYLMIILAKLLIILMVSETKLKLCDHKFSLNFYASFGEITNENSTQKKLYNLIFLLDFYLNIG